MDRFYELFCDGEDEYVYDYQKDHVDIYINGNYHMTRPCTEAEIISAWDRIHNY